MSNKTRRSIADETEVLEFYTDLMRHCGDEGIKVTDSINAADKLLKHLTQTAAAEKEEKQTGVVILPEAKLAKEEHR